MCVKCEEAKGILEEFIASGPKVLREHYGHHSSTAMLEIAITQDLQNGNALSLAKSLYQMVGSIVGTLIANGKLPLSAMFKPTEQAKQLMAEMVAEGLVDAETVAQLQQGQQDQEQQDDVEVVV